MHNWQNFYLVRLFHANKWIALVITIFFILNLSANLIVPTQITPIYNWNLYAYPLPAQDTFSFISVEYNDGKKLSFKRTWREPQKILLTNTLNLFKIIEIDRKDDYSKKHFDEVWLQQHPRFKEIFPDFQNFPGKKEMKHFPTWYKRYLQEYVGEPINGIHIYQKQVIFNETEMPEEISSYHIFTIK